MESGVRSYRGDNYLRVLAKKEREQRVMKSQQPCREFKQVAGPLAPNKGANMEELVLAAHSRVKLYFSFQHRTRSLSLS